MGVFFSRLKVGHPAPQRVPSDQEPCWRVYTVCRSEHPNSTYVYADVGEMEHEQIKKARTACITLFGYAATGLPLEQMYDDKRCHPAHEFDLDSTGNNKCKIWRIRSDVIRIYFIYGPDRSIIVLQILVKNSDKLNAGELKELERRAQEVYDCLCQFSLLERTV